MASNTITTSSTESIIESAPSVPNPHLETHNLSQPKLHTPGPRSRSPSPSPLPSSSAVSHHETSQSGGSIARFDINDNTTNVTTALADGGEGWKIVICCAILNFFVSGFLGSWGVLQTALLSSSLPDSQPSTTSWVASLAMGITTAFGLLVVRMITWIGVRRTALLGQTLFSLGVFSSGFATSNVGGLFGTSGVLVGVGFSMIFVITNSLPVQYFSGSLGGKLGLANGIVKAGGGLGATILSLGLEVMNRKVGIAWTFRICGLLSLVLGLPAAWMVVERERVRVVSPVEISIFKSPPYAAVFAAGAICVFALYVPPFFLPLFAESIGLSTSEGAGIVAGFSLCATLGRFFAGPLCDWIGAVNTLLLMMLLNAVSMLAIWPVSSSMPPLIIFAVLNGIANGAFFTAIPTVISGLVGPGQTAVALSMAVTGWTFGYLMGSPIAGYILEASRSMGANHIALYRPAIFYTGGIALLSSLFLVFARVHISKDLSKRI